MTNFVFSRIEVMLEHFITLTMKSLKCNNRNDSLTHKNMGCSYNTLPKRIRNGKDDFIVMRISKTAKTQLKMEILRIA